jgi:RNA polymerase sigma-70 factor (ECF subfamily)
MHTTSDTLLNRLAQSPSEADWQRFVHLYTPLLYYWANRNGLQGHDAADLVQDVLALLVEKLPKFRYERGKSFRGWLRTVPLNKWRDRRVGVGLASLENHKQPAAPDGVELLEEQEYRRYLSTRALALMKTDFEPETWKACWECVVNDRAAAEVATELGITVNAVYLAKSRVLSRLRRDLEGLLD